MDQHLPDFADVHGFNNTGAEVDDKEIESYAELGDPLPDDVPQMSHWRVCLQPVKPKVQTKGGILLPGTAQKAQEALACVGRVVSMGDLVWTSKRFINPITGEPSRGPKIGEWVVTGQYAGQTIRYGGRVFRVLDDDAILGFVDNPEKIAIYIP